MRDISSTGYVRVGTSITIEGQNKKQFQVQFTDVTGLTFQDVFQNGVTTVRGSWSSDGGDLAAPADTRERRYLCIKGYVKFTFSGVAISVRTSVNPGWGRASVLIDGVMPSTIPGLSKSLDVVTCNSYELGTFGNEHIDQIVADGLAPGEHTLELLCHSNTPKEFFVLSGVKVFDPSDTLIEHELWSVDWDKRNQSLALDLHMTGSTRVLDPVIELGEFLHSQTGTQIITAPQLSSLSPINVLVDPLTSSTSSDAGVDANINLTYKVPDPTGDIERTAEAIIPYSDAGITYGGAWWTDEPLPEGFPEKTRSCASRTAWMMFPGSEVVKLRVWTDFGLGIGIIYKDAIIKNGVTIASRSPNITMANTDGLVPGMTIVHTRFATGTTILSIAGTTVTMSTNATGANANQSVPFGMKIQELSTSEAVEAKQRTYQVKDVVGLPAGYTGKILVQCKTTASFSFTWFSNTKVERYTELSQQLTLRFKLNQVMPEPITNTRLENGRVVFAEPDYSASNLTAETPYDNNSTSTVEVEYRFPTFICCYSSGFTELFKQYDIVITDPGALNRKEVMELQALGIQVYMYVSFGEEDGDMINKWDAQSPQGPYVGDGTGPGGYAGYYLKGGHQYGEFSECNNDRQRMEGVKACSKLNPKYYTGVGRCSKACNNDWRQGYVNWEKGLPCGGGFTSANNWIRDASTACSNSACPEYTPVHAKCTQFEETGGTWGQDFSIMTADFPDENGIWSSYYIDAVGRGPGSWYARLQEHYLPLIFNEPESKSETLVVEQHLLLDSSPVLGVKISSAFDESYEFNVVDTLTGYEYLKDVEYSYNKMTGVFLLTPNESPSSLDYVAPSAGRSVTVNFYSRGLGADGVFMDTVDTVDVYPSPEYQQGFADLINDLKTEWSHKKFCSNRGFSIYDKMIQSCDLIMTESVFSDYNFVTGTYQEVSEGAAVWNREVTRMIQELRRNHTFDVVCLNYAPNGPEGDAIRSAVVEKTLALGWMPWLSTILLNDPLPNNQFSMVKGYIRSNRWHRTRIINIKEIT